MTDLLTWAYHAGFALFLGSILTFVVGSSLAANASLDDLVFARRLIRRATLAITVPGLWMAALSLVTLWLLGAAPAWRLGAVVLLLAVSHALVVPATRACLAQAEASRSAGRLSDAFRRAYLRESVPGAINVLVAFALLFERQ